MTIHFHTNTNIWLHFEDYYNAGLTPEEVKNVLKNMCDPFGYNYFYPEPSGLNHNWIIQTRARHHDDIAYIVNLIKDKLNLLMKEKNKK